MAKTPRKTVAQLQEEHRAGARRIASFIALKATQNPNTLWADPLIPYQHLIHGLWLRDEINLKMLDRTEWMERVRAFTEKERAEFREITDCSDVAALMLVNDLGTADVEILGRMMTSDHDQAEPYFVYRVGTDRMYSYGTRLCPKEELEAEADMHRATADAIDELTKL